MNTRNAGSLSIIIVTHNSAADILPCLQAIERGRADVPAEVIVVDAGSRDGTIELLATVAFPIRILCLRNVGFAAAANAGAAQAHGAFLLFVNPDAVITPGSLRAFVESFQDPRVHVVGGVLQDRENVPEPLVGAPYPSLRRTLASHGALRLRETFSENALVSVPWVSGGLLGVRRDVFRARRGFRERFFLYFEDVDFCRRVRLQRGWVLQNPGVRAFHRRGQSTQAAARRRAYDVSQQRYFSTHRSRREAYCLHALRALYRSASAILGILVMSLPLAVLAAGLQVRLLVAAAVITLLTLAVSRKPMVGILLLCATLFLGQSARLPLRSLEATVTDAALPFVLAGLLLHAYQRGALIFFLRTIAAAWWIPAALLPGLLLASERLPGSEWQQALLYALRLGAVLLLIPLLKCARVSFRATARALAGTAALLAGVGYLQYLLLPSLPPARETVLSQLLLGWSGGGWDPHEQRLFATWLDPNFLGGFFVFVLALHVAQASSFLRRRAQRRELVLTVGNTALLTSALTLTRSRSSFVAFGALLGSMLFWKFGRRLFIPVATSVLVILVMSPRVTARLREISLADPTVQLRLASSRQSLRHIRAFPVFGAGYNAYGAEQLAAGHISSLAIHSRGATDNVVLMTLATTGLWGTALLGGGILATIRRLCERVRRGDAAALGAFLALLVLIVHSQFLQSLTYIHLLVPLALVLGSASAIKERP